MAIDFGRVHRRWIPMFFTLGALVLIAAAALVAWRPELVIGRQEPLVRSVFIFPPAAAQAGAAWRLTGQWRSPGKQDGEETLWAVEFKPVPDWETPPPVLLSQAERGVDVRGVYQPAPFTREPPIKVAGSVVLADAAVEWARLALERSGAGEVRRLPGLTPDATEVEGAFFASKVRRSIDVRAVGTEAGITALMSRACMMALSSRPLTVTEEASGLQARMVGRDALAVVVAPGNPVRTLDMDALRDIFSGRIQRWSEVGGPDAPITVVALEPNFGTQQLFQELVLGYLPLTTKVRWAPSPAAVDALVADDPGAIGYTSLPLTQRAALVAVRTEAGQAPVLPSPVSVRDGSYPLVRSLFVAWRKDAPPSQLLETIFSSEGKRILERFGFLVSPS